MNTGGSSSGIGTAANFWAGSVGTETSGSILSPSNASMLVGIKPTVGLISRYGVIPITADQDTAGPMTKTVKDAAIMLGAMAGPDPNDVAGSSRCTLPPNRDYARDLRTRHCRAHGSVFHGPASIRRRSIRPPAPAAAASTRRRPR